MLFTVSLSVSVREPLNDLFEDPLGGRLIGNQQLMHFCRKLTEASRPNGAKTVDNSLPFRKQRRGTQGCHRSSDPPVMWVIITERARAYVVLCTRRRVIETSRAYVV